jgi:hypothetical protein
VLTSGTLARYIEQLAVDLVYAVALEDLTAAADLFRPVWEASGGADG